MGGIDVRTLYTNNREIIDSELESKIPIVKQNNGFILHSDHSIPHTVDYETFQYYLEKGRQLGTY
jgi:uroporphyrinogen decarboxylase